MNALRKSQKLRKRPFLLRAPIQGTASAREHLFEKFGVIWKCWLIIWNLFGVNWCYLVLFKSFLLYLKIISRGSNAFRP